MNTLRTRRPSTLNPCRSTAKPSTRYRRKSWSFPRMSGWPEEERTGRTAQGRQGIGRRLPEYLERQERRRARGRHQGRREDRSVRTQVCHPPYFPIYSQSLTRLVFFSIDFSRHFPSADEFFRPSYGEVIVLARGQIGGERAGRLGGCGFRRGEAEKKRGGISRKNGQEWANFALVLSPTAQLQQAA